MARVNGTADFVGRGPHHLKTKEKRRLSSVDVTNAALRRVEFCSRAYLRVMSAHGSITSEGAARVTVTGVWKRIVFDLVVPRFDKLENGSIAADMTDRVRIKCPGHFIWSDIARRAKRKPL